MQGMFNLDHGYKWRVSYTKPRKIWIQSVILYIQQKIATQIKDILGINSKHLLILITRLNKFQHQDFLMIRLLHLAVLLLKACLTILFRFNMLQRKKACRVKM